jgi:hypothetical protein
VVKSARSIAKTEEDEDGAAQELRYTLLTVAVAGREYKVLHADLSSPLLTADVFLLHTKQVHTDHIVIYLLLGVNHCICAVICSTRSPCRRRIW